VLKATTRTGLLNCPVKRSSDGLEGRLRFIGLAICAAGFAKVVEHDMHGDVEMGHQGRC
jgi:hypothetical protein